MGKYNSSEHRVVPFMDYIKDNLGELNILLSLLEQPGCDFRITSTPKKENIFYGKNEKCLKPFKKHLLEMISHVSNHYSYYKSIKNKDRAQLFSADPNIRKVKQAEAIKCLNDQYENLSANSRNWFVFEGFTQPDIFIEGDDYILLGEGKWTEKHITESTFHLNENNGGYRNQMVRHIEGALNYCESNNLNKCIIAFYIVDDDCTYKESLSKDSFIKQLSKETISKDDELKQKIIDSFAGFTTWQKVEAAFPNMKRFKTKQEL